MKLSQYAKNLGIHYKTAWRHWHENKLNGYQDPTTGTIYVLDQDTNVPMGSQIKAILYARVSSTTNKASLDGEQLLTKTVVFCIISILFLSSCIFW